jgi:hypothetical protein
MVSKPTRRPKKNTGPKKHTASSKNGKARRPSPKKPEPKPAGRPAPILARPIAGAKPAPASSPQGGSPAGPPVRRRFDLEKLRLVSLRDRRPAIRLEQFARVIPPIDGFRKLFDSLPDLEDAARLRALVQRIVAARKSARPVVFAVGSDAVRGGISTLVIDLMRKGVITSLALDGPGALDDAEVCISGGAGLDAGASEDERVALSLESAQVFGRAAARARRLGLGLGRGVGHLLLESKSPHADVSLLAEAAKLNLPATIHVAIGSDPFQATAGMDGAALGEAALRDFRTLCETVGRLDGGVWCGLSESPILGDTFARAVSAARNLGFTFATATCARIGGTAGDGAGGAAAWPGSTFRFGGPTTLIVPLLRQAILVATA